MSLRDAAQAFEPKAKTQNIADLPQVSIDEVELQDASGTNNETQETFTYKYITVDGVDYRVPYVVLGQLKTQLENNSKLDTFKVVKSGHGMQTQYTVVPLTYKGMEAEVEKV